MTGTLLTQSVIVDVAATKRQILIVGIDNNLKARIIIVSRPILHVLP